MSRLMLVSLVPCLLLVAVADAEEAVDSLGGTWAGTWLLDPKASDPVEPMLVLLKTPWIARKAAAAMTPTLRITALGHGGLRVINENPIRTTNQEIFIDGVKREQLDPLGRKVVRSATLSATGQLIVGNWNHVEEDEVIEVTSTWSLAGNTLEISNVIQGEDDALVIRRIFRKQ